MNAVETGATRRTMTCLGRLAVRRPWQVIIGWLLLTATIGALVAGFGRPVEEDVSLPGSDAQLGRDLVEAHVPGASNATGQIILKIPQGRLEDPANQAAIAAAAAQVRQVEHVVEVVPPSAQLGTISADGRIGYATVNFDLGPREVGHDLSDRVVTAASPAAEAGIQTVPGGALALPETETRTSELLGLAVALAVLLVAFGGLVAAGLPLLTAVVTLVCGLGLIGLAGHVTGMPSVATTLATMIGLGVGIDYALFLLTRYRALLAADTLGKQAIVETVASSGSAVAFAGGTVIVALGGLAIAGVPILATLGWTAGLTVVLAVASATTLLPALLAVLGPRVNSLRLIRARDGEIDDSRWGRIADRVTRHPLRYAIAASIVLLALAAPVLGMKLGQTDAGDQPKGTAARTGHEILAEGFGPGINGPISVVAEPDSPITGPADPRLASLTQHLKATPGVARVEQPRIAPDGALVTVRVIPATAPSDPATIAFVESVLDTPVEGMRLHATGQTAIRGALADRIADRMPWLIGIVVLVSALLLLIAFRAPVIAVKAALMNLLSIGAAYGALTAVFTWSWGVELTGLDGPIPVEAYLPMMLFALLFGLSMDYEVFLLTAVQESWQATRDNRLSVRRGLAGTGKVITSAALIMVCVFASFVLHTNPVVKMFGLGMAVAIAVDATIIRGLLVPATMALLGKANWWSPACRRRGRQP
ncbi:MULTISPECIES: MMPL family transporter [unclassified Micromonospora]|uniref:MMPL family transporter n=1 Tax=unclassified Micromonospora TaxID=2617518 RepID=UPI001C23CBD0|nr:MULTISPECIES: MMPL family transporter [unclassified Micromonospora]MBU8858630.1 MMPL family transporter [Micromonospora sp. WMMB482]MDM4784274.1 MMPL family transporter [Micromonospora sp. b486]